MIVRIVGDDQYRMADDDLAELNGLDNAVVAAVATGQDEAFRSAFDRLLTFVRTQGTPIAEDESPESDVFIPFADISLAEAVDHFTGEGVVPD